MVENMQVEETVSKAVVTAEIDRKQMAKLAKLKRKQDKQKAMHGSKLSGKWWKDDQRSKFSVIKNPNARQKNLKLQMKKKEEIKLVTKLKKEIIAAKLEKSEHRRQRCKQNAERTLENQRKAEVVQLIKDPTKIKKMNRKQLRSVEKRDIDNIKTK